ncbi:hypothetical protein C8R45DRAFT_940991 [Mycena sanguinolenta]|nr:hypothetical protein C8R45DRAFT_940991 [Mycena sanguinolenta]
MSAASARSQKPLLLPGIAPHLFQSRAAARPQRPNPMLAKNDSVAGPVLDHDAEHPRTPSDGLTAVATTQDDVDARSYSPLEKLRALATRVDTIQAQLQQLQDRLGARLGSAWASLRDTLRFIVLWLLAVWLRELMVIYSVAVVDSKRSVHTEVFRITRGYQRQTAAQARKRGFIYSRAR